MNYARTMKSLRLLVFVAVALLLVGSDGNAQLQGHDGAPGKDQKTVFRLPEGFIPVDFPGNPSVKLALDSKSQAGIFLDRSDQDDGPGPITAIMQSAVAKMLLRDPKGQLEWTGSPLPPHAGAFESGMLYSASKGELRFQLAVYYRELGSAKFRYGYFALKHRNKQEGDGPFIDLRGRGAYKFDQFRQLLLVVK
jgi:hypothetical protein